MDLHLSKPNQAWLEQQLSSGRIFDHILDEAITVLRSVPDRTGEDHLHQWNGRLRAAGLLRNNPIPHDPDYWKNLKPMKLKGKALSESILEERQ